MLLIFSYRYSIFTLLSLFFITRLFSNKIQIRIDLFHVFSHPKLRTFAENTSHFHRNLALII